MGAYHVGDQEYTAMASNQPQNTKYMIYQGEKEHITRYNEI